MRPTWWRGVAVAGVVLLISSGPAGAQDDSDLSQETLDRLRALAPEGDPGESDIQEGDERFGELLALFGEEATSITGTGSNLEGVCGGYAYSFDKNGALLDGAFAAGDGSPPRDVITGEQAFTSSNRFRVDTEGIVKYYGFMPRSGDGPADHTWTITTSGISLDKGGDPNTSLKNRNAGIVDLADDLPVKFNANVAVSGRLDSTNIGSCVGDGHVEFIAPFANPVALGSIAALGGGIFGLLFNARPARTYRGTS